MIICVCKAVSDRTIRRAVDNGDVVALRDLTRETGLGTCCGKCVPAAREVLHGALAAEAARADRPARFSGAIRNTLGFEGSLL